MPQFEDYRRAAGSVVDRLFVILGVITPCGLARQTDHATSFTLVYCE
jgi:hypothetical protein